VCNSGGVCFPVAVGCFGKTAFQVNLQTHRNACFTLRNIMIGLLVGIG